MMYFSAFNNMKELQYRLRAGKSKFNKDGTQWMADSSLGMLVELVKQFELSLPQWEEIFKTVFPSFVVAADEHAVRVLANVKVRDYFLPLSSSTELSLYEVEETYTQLEEELALMKEYVKTASTSDMQRSVVGFTARDAGFTELRPVYLDYCTSAYSHLEIVLTLQEVYDLYSGRYEHAYQHAKWLKESTADQRVERYGYSEERMGRLMEVLTAEAASHSTFTQAMAEVERGMYDADGEYVHGPTEGLCREMIFVLPLFYYMAVCGMDVETEWSRALPRLVAMELNKPVRPYE